MPNVGFTTGKKTGKEGWQRRTMQEISALYEIYIFHVIPGSSTVRKFHDFSITQILREINFGNFRSAKSAILTHLEALTFDVYEFLYSLKAKIFQINITQSH